MSELDESYALARVAARAGDEVKALDIKALDVHEKLPFTDVFLLLSAESERQVGAIVDAVDRELHKLGHRARFKEGKQTARWVLLDYGMLVVHVFHREDREFYNLERLWKDCPAVDLELEVLPVGGLEQAERTGDMESVELA